MTSEELTDEEIAASFRSIHRWITGIKRELEKLEHEMEKLEEYETT